MKTIFLFIRETKLKMELISILLRNHLYYIEASNIDDLSVKLDLAGGAGLMIQDYKEGEKEDDLAEVLRTANYHQLPVLWIMSGDMRHLLPDTAREYITDLLLLPFNDATLLWKINGIIRIAEKHGKTKQISSTSRNLISNHSDFIINAMELAAKGKYSICIIRLQITSATMEINLQVLEKLKYVLRDTDRIMEMDLGEFIILCPFTPARSLQIVETKINNAVDPIIRNLYPALIAHIYGVGYPDDVSDYNELEAEIINGSEFSLVRHENTETILHNKIQKYQNMLYQANRKKKQ